MARRQSDSQEEGETGMKYHIEFDLDFKRNPYKGKFIAFEGIDAAGKTTHVNDLRESFPKNEKVFLTKSPSDSEIGRFIRKILTGKTDVPQVAFQHLFSADRVEQEEIIAEHLKKGETVISDRYFWSAVAYGMADVDDVSDQTGNRLMVANSILSHFHQLILPDLTICLDISVKTSISRLAKMDKAKEIYEQEDKLKEVKKAYDWLINKFPKEFTVVDAEKSEEEVSDVVLSLVKSLQK